MLKCKAACLARLKVWGVIDYWVGCEQVHGDCYLLGLVTMNF